MNRTSQILALTVAAVLLSNCGDKKPPAQVGDAHSQLCAGVNGLIGNEISAEYTISDKVELAGKLAAAAEADASAIKNLGKASVSTDAQSSLANTITGVVKSKASVSQDFFEQQESFNQTACYLEQILSNKTLSPDQHTKMEGFREKLLTARTNYVDGLSAVKKN